MQVCIKEKERSQDIFEHVTGMLKEAGPENVNGYIDRAQRVGKTYFDEKYSKKCKSIIVKFTAFQHQKIFCWLKKNVKDNTKLRVDVTKKGTAY